ncbi:hypothetical protein EMCRGX_G006165 [Ephydatia muelleri]
MLSQPILAPKYNVHQRSKEHDMVQRLAWNLWIRINLLIRYILMIRHECCIRIGCNANTYYDLYFFLALERNECHRAQIVNTGANVTESGFLPNVETKQN